MQQPGPTEQGRSLERLPVHGLPVLPPRLCDLVALHFGLFIFCDVCEPSFIEWKGANGV